MSALIVNPHYCPEDKDILDFIKSVSVALPELIAYLRKRGVYVSAKATKDDLANLIARETFAWRDVEEIITLLTIPLKRDNYVPGEHTSEADFELLEQAIAAARTFRSTKYGDRISVYSTGDEQYRVTIEYKDIDYEKTRLIQTVERDAEITLIKTPNGFQTRRTSDQRAKDVELAIIGEFEKLAAVQNHTVSTSKFLLSQLVSITDKENFFTKMMEGISGFAFEEIVSMRVQSAKTPEIELDSDEDEDAKSYVATIQSLVMTGHNVGATPLYDECVGKDYYPMSATWMVRSDQGDIARAELKASFVPDLNDHELQFSTSAIWRFDGDKLSPREKPSPIVAARFAELLRNGASTALNQILNPPAT